MMLFLELLLVGGNPKIPYIGVPLAIFPLIFFAKKLIYGRCFSGFKISLIFSSFFLFWMSFVWLVRGGGGADLYFIVVLFYKFVVGIYLADIVYRALLSKGFVIELYIFFQIILIVLSAFHESVYEFLLLFQTADATAVFGEIFGLRSVGFGVVHNEGGAFLVSLYLFSLFLRRKRAASAFYGLLMYGAAFSSRMVFLLLFIVQAVYKFKSLLALSLFVAICSVSIDTYDGVWGEFFELFNALNFSTDYSIRSVSVMSEMKLYPDHDDLIAWVVGDGIFFSSDGFYMGTDIGFSRIIFAGGLVGVFLYIVANLIAICHCFEYVLCRRRYVILFVVSVVLFFLGNFKGVSVQNWVFLEICMCSLGFSEKNSIVKKNRYMCS